MRNPFGNLCAALLACCAVTAADASDLAYPSADNVPYGMLGSWFDPATSGEGFDVQFYADADHGSAAILYWYTFDPAGTQKVWFLALGPIDGDTAHLQIAEPTSYQGFDRPPATDSRNEAVGTIDFRLVDCAHAHVAWHFTRTLDNGLGAADDGEADLQRLAPALSIQGKDVCSTPLSAFGFAGSGGSDALGQCVASYNGLLAQYQQLDAGYAQCTNAVARDDSAIDDLESEVASLRADIDGAYDDGYSAGASSGYDDGYNSGYGDGYSASYDGGYNDGYGDGYSAGYDACGDGSTIASKGLLSMPEYAASSRSVTIPAPSATHVATARAAGAARSRANQAIDKIMAQLQALKTQRQQI